MKSVRNYLRSKKISHYYHQTPWMTDNIKKYLEERSKLTKYFYKNGRRESDYNVLEKSAECTWEIFKAKKKYIVETNLKILILLQEHTGLYFAVCSIMKRSLRKQHYLEFQVGIAECRS